MKILHTSDWHVDLHSAQLGDAAAAARAARWRAIEKLTEIARKNCVDLVLVAGDTFDSVDADDETVQRVIEVLNDFRPASVVVLPGNHDPLVAGGVWERSGWRKLEDHVVLATNNDEIVLECAPDAGAPGGVVVFPCPIRQKQSRLDPTQNIPVREPGDTRLRIGLAHGSLDTMGKVENFPIAQDRAALVGLDYLALGDWHGQRMFPGYASAYPGTPERTSFSERGAGSVLLVEIDGDRSAAPLMEPIAVGQCQWLQRAVLLRDTTDLAELEADLLALGKANRALVRLKVRVVNEKGTSSSGPAGRQTTLLGGSGETYRGGTLVGAVEAFRCKWQERLLYFDWQLEELAVSSSDLPQGLVSIDETLRLALEGAGLEEDLHDLGEVDPAVLREARVQLRMLAAEAGS